MIMHINKPLDGQSAKEMSPCLSLVPYVFMAAVGNIVF